MWGVFFFTLSGYLLLAYSAGVYVLSLTAEVTIFSSTKTRSRFVNVDGVAASAFLFSLPLLLLIVTNSWIGPIVTSGFGHLTFSAFERKLMLLVLFTFSFFLAILLNSSDFSNSGSYDYFLTLLHLTFWLLLLFLTNNIFSLAFVVEVLTALITLMLVTSYNNSFVTSTPHGGYQGLLNTPSIPSTYFYSLLTFFWTSLVTTLTLFLFLMFMYSKFLTVDNALVSVVATHTLVTSSLTNLSTLSFTFSFFLLTIFLKCAITPFFLWKPTFFKGLTFQTLFYYIFVFYFTLFLFFTHFLLGIFSEITFLNLSLLVVTLLISTFLLPLLTYETLNLKSFLAISSIMNSVIILFTILSLNALTSGFYL